MSQPDYLQRILFEDINARSVWVRLDGVVAEVLGETDYPTAVGELLAQALLVIATLSSGIKFKGRISLQLQSSGPLKLLMADCTEDGGLRGIARLAEGAEVPARADALFEQLRADGILTLTLEPPAGGQRWQGIVPLEGDSLAEAIEAYFVRSEQLDTRIRLAVGQGRAVALMIQEMPGEAEDEDGWNRLKHLIATVQPKELLELDSESLFKRLFHEEKRRIFEPRPLRFFCPCNRDRVLEVLAGLGATELGRLAEEQDSVEVRCQFCNRAYEFDPFDLSAISSTGEEGSRTLH
jgi:molecular chaperone Hsp33